MQVFSQSLDWIVWNIFLALIPVAASTLFVHCFERFSLNKRVVPWPVWLPLLAVWLAFLPNSCYLVTEWRHFLFEGPFGPGNGTADDRESLITAARLGCFYLIYSGIGLVAFALSIRPIERLLRLLKLRPVFFASPFFFLVSLGVYLGLIVRLNSWDLLTRPRYVFDIILHALLDPGLLKIIVVFAVMLWLAYEALDVFFDGLQARRRGLLPSET